MNTTDPKAEAGSKKCPMNLLPPVATGKLQDDRVKTVDPEIERRREMYKQLELIASHV